MPATTLARTLATAVCGAWLCASVVQPANAAEQVKTIQLRGGELRLVNNDERKPKAVINGKDFLFMPDSIGFKETLELSDRDIIILTTEEYGRPKYRVFSLTTAGLARELDDLTYWSGTFVATKKGDAIHFDLGYYHGLKVNAVVSPAGVDVSRRPVAHPAIEKKDCTWMHEKALDDCMSLDRSCEPSSLPFKTSFAMQRFEHHPRWKIAESRFEATCKSVCKAKKRPSYKAFAKNVCGP